MELLEHDSTTVVDCIVVSESAKTNTDVDEFKSDFFGRSKA